MRRSGVGTLTATGPAGLGLRGLAGGVRLGGLLAHLERHAVLPRQRLLGIRELPLDVVPDCGGAASVAHEVAERRPEFVLDPKASHVLAGVRHKRRVRLIITLWQQVTPQLRMVSRRGCPVSGLIHGFIVGTFGPTSQSALTLSPHRRRTVFLQLNVLDRGHDDCIHRRYVLTCAQYEELLARSRGFCELCGQPGATQQWGKLCIDHDHRYGLWAVRGLLCHGCNRVVDQLPPTHPSVAPYLASAWHLGKGWSLAQPDEPSLRSLIREPRGKAWERSEAGWRRLNPYGSRPRSVRLDLTWREIVHRFGGHNLLLRPAGDEQWRPLFA